MRLRIIIQGGVSKLLQTVMIAGLAWLCAGCQFIEAKAGKAGLALMSAEAQGGSEDDTGAAGTGGESGSERAGVQGSIDAAFMRALARASLEMVEIGRVGAEGAQNSELRQYSQRVAESNRQLYKQLEPLAEQQGVEIPTSVDLKQQATLEGITALEGKEFDEALAGELLRNGAAIVFETRTTMPKLRDPEVIQIAKLTSPIWKREFQRAVKAARAAGLPSEQIERLTEQARTATRLARSGSYTARQK